MASTNYESCGEVRRTAGRGRIDSSHAMSPPDLTFYSTTAQVLPVLFLVFAVERVVRPINRADAVEIERVVRERHHERQDSRPLVSDEDAIGWRERKEILAAGGFAIVSLVVVAVAEVVSLKVLSIGRPIAYSRDVVVGALGWSGYVIGRYVIQRETRLIGDVLGWELTDTRRRAGTIIIVCLVLAYGTWFV